MAPQLWHQLLVLPLDFVVSVLPTPLRDPSQGAGEPRYGGLTLDHPMCLPGAAPIVGEAQKLKGLRPSVLLVAVLLVWRGWSREPNHAGLVSPNPTITPSRAKEIKSHVGPKCYARHARSSESGLLTTVNESNCLILLHLCFLIAIHDRDVGLGRLTSVP